MNKIKFIKLTNDLRKEQVFGGEIVVNKITTIKPYYKKNDPLTQSIEFEANESDLKTIFYDIWAAVGDDILTEWIAEEGIKVDLKIKEDNG